MLETEKTTKKSDCSRSVHYLHTYIQIIYWQARGFLCSFFSFVYSREPCVIMWDRVTFTRKWRRKPTDECVTGCSVEETARKMSFSTASWHRLVAVSAPTWLAVRAACSLLLLLRIQVLCSGAVGRPSAVLQKEAREPHRLTMQSTRTRLVMQAVLFFFFFFLFPFVF